MGKRGRGKSKGNTFERQTCVRLSRWWSGNQRDDLFWRTGGSGGRATMRNKKGKQTYGQYGDICSTHPDGDSLISQLTIELKRGYNRTTIADLLDKPKKAAKQEMEGFLAQAIESHSQSNSLSWFLIHRRDRRESLVFFSEELFDSLCLLGCFVHLPSPFAMFCLRVNGEHHRIVCMKFEAFLSRVKPKVMKRLKKLG